MGLTYVKTIGIVSDATSIRGHHVNVT